MSTTTESTHWGDCWRVHDDCALTSAAEVLQNLLELTRCAIADHADEKHCSAADVGYCWAAKRARDVLTWSSS